MILRIVRLTFKPEFEEAFKQVFEEKRALIAAFEGCQKVNLLQDVSNANVFFTISEWNSENELKQYRNSVLFRETWATVKQWFAAPPIAHSTVVL
jgi:heme-degrading monooxygenase HmoA